MKGDFSRLTFDPQDNVRAVMIQQGRPLDDASLNEASAVTVRRIETEALDVIGTSGAPLHGGGFRIVRNVGELTAEEAADPRNQVTIAGTPAFLLTAGRIYVDGVQIENHRLCAVSEQPPPTPPLPALTADGRKLIYLKATIDHRTGVEMNRLLDPAFGDADTSTRTLVAWQVRALSVGSGAGCGDDLADWNTLTAALAGRVKVSVDTGAAATDPCKLTAGAGYTRPENLLYRVEVDGGVAIATVDGESHFQRDGLVVKISRNDAAEVAKAVTVNGNDITVDVDTRDGMPVFRAGEYVEVLAAGDTTDIGMQIGWAHIDSVNGESITLAAGHNAVPGCRVRLWSVDRVTLNAANAFSVSLDGIKFEFQNDGYLRGTYFLVPARYATADVLLTPEQKAAPLAPMGPEIHYTRLGFVDIVGGVVQPPVTDCRKIFEPLTEQLMFQYVGGDGQEAVPGGTLRQPLSVRVSYGRFPLAGATVRFQIETGNGQIAGAAPGAPLDVSTDAEGIASCQWTLDSNPLEAARSQLLSAKLLDMQALPVPTARPGCVVRFGATASATIVHRAGDGQDAAPNQTLEHALEVRIANEQTPLGGAQVVFVVMAGGGTIATAMPVTTDVNGIASAQWQLGAAGSQSVEARWTDALGNVVQTVAFDAQVRPAQGGGCAVTIGPGEDLDSAALQELLAKNDGHLCLCFAAGRHKIGRLEGDGHGKMRLSIHGCGETSVIELAKSVDLRRFVSVDIDNITLIAQPNASCEFSGIQDLTLSRWSANVVNASSTPFLRFVEVQHITLDACSVAMSLPGLCAVFVDADSSVDITDCDLNGLVSFYGEPVSSSLPPVPPINFMNVAANLVKDTQLGAGRGRLRLESNRFDALVLGREMVTRIDALTPHTVIDRLYADALLVGNSFAFVGTQVIATRIALSGNAFMGPRGNDDTAALLFAGGSAAAGNVGLLDSNRYVVRLITPPGRSKEAGNAVHVQTT